MAPQMNSSTAPATTRKRFSSAKSTRLRIIYSSSKWSSPARGATAWRPGPNAAADRSQGFWTTGLADERECQPARPAGFSDDGRRRPPDPQVAAGGENDREVRSGMRCGKVSGQPQPTRKDCALWQQARGQRPAAVAYRAGLARERRVRAAEGRRERRRLRAPKVSLPIAKENRNRLIGQEGADHHIHQVIAVDVARRQLQPSGRRGHPEGL